MTYVQAAAVNVKDAYATVWRHRMLVLTTFAVLMLASAALIGIIPRVYKASANVLIVNGNSRNDPTLSSPDIPTLATSTGVLDRVNQRLGLKMPLMQLKNEYYGQGLRPTSRGSCASSMPTRAPTAPR